MRAAGIRRAAEFTEQTSGVRGEGWHVPKALLQVGLIVLRPAITVRAHAAKQL